MRKNRAGMKLETARIGVEDGYPEYVRRQQIAGELNAIESEHLQGINATIT